LIYFPEEFMRSACFFLLALALSACASARPSTATLPPACLEKCATAFGILLGRTPEDVPAYSNCQPLCLYKKTSFAGNEYAGIEWQCVEFARRWLIQTRQLTFPSVEVAADLWDKVHALEWVSDHEKVPLTNVANGAAVLPIAGDLLIYSRDYLGTGHVAVVLGIDPKRGTVRVGEENFRNEAWPGPYSRAIPFKRVNGRFWLEDPYLLGWKTYKP
jgi:glutathionylspermidine amidase/synthetase